MIGKDSKCADNSRGEKERREVCGTVWGKDEMYREKRCAVISVGVGKEKVSGNTGVRR